MPYNTSPLIDYITFSIPGVKASDLVGIEEKTKELFHTGIGAGLSGGYGGHVIAGYGVYGIREVGDFYDVIFSLPGKAMSALRETIDDVSVLKLFDPWVLSGKGRFTRIDVSVDIYDMRVDVGWWYRCIESGKYTCAANGKVDKDTGEKFNLFQSHSADGIVNTITAGRRGGARRIIIYNKSLEQRMRGAEQVPEGWTRVELTCGSENGTAAAAAAAVLKDGLQVCYDLIAGYLQIENEAYEEIFKNVRKLGCPGRAETDPERVWRWLRDPHSGIPKSLFLLREHLGNAALIDILELGKCWLLALTT